MTKEEFLTGKPFRHNQNIFKFENAFTATFISKRIRTEDYSYYAKITEIGDDHFSCFTIFFGIVVSINVKYSELTEV
jgi:hypothetical protein